MTASRDSYPDPEALSAAVGRLDDPLTDPLPGRESHRPPPPAPQRPAPGVQASQGQTAGEQPAHAAPDRVAPPGDEPRGGQGSPWFRPRGSSVPQPRASGPAMRNVTATRPIPVTPAPEPTATPAPDPAAEPVPPPGPASRGPGPDRERGPESAAADPNPGPAPRPAPDSRLLPDDAPVSDAEPDPETVALRQVERRRETTPSPPGEGRAARRRAAAQAARARKESAAVIASRGVGELFITFGIVLLLFVAYQLWWTNVQAALAAGREANALEEKWESQESGAREPGSFDPGEGFAKLYIPKLDVVVPVAEGIDKDTVLDRGLAGHYDEASGLKTAMPWDEEGNFAVAGHRNTHGEPFRYINQLEPGDPIVVETRDTYYVYEMTSLLPSTSPSNVDVIAPVPQQSGFTEPGRYLTLTTCTPEFTSTYRLIVWGKMVEERPRGEGKPDALVG
ncbi:class E sortase [Streptomyces sp. JJ66]|uniref:class E sortase n=1 Tax=Streptomyces sp. JJ66 TaxID=2803843 RepID=UPI001C59E69E|nr:class E sortase [Streptomyces sp. JJ66]MBW1601801.1 class E sortase [Streptomyces sp. JJ66]